MNRLNGNRVSGVMRVRNLLTLIYFKSCAELRSEAERTFAGFIWWILDPLFSLLIYYIVFSQISRIGNDPGSSSAFIHFLCVGIVFWGWMANTVNRGANAILLGAGIMQQVRLPKVIFPSSMVLTDTAKFGVVLLILVLVLLCSGCRMGLSYVALPFVLLCELTFILGATFFVAAITPFFPDFRLFLAHGLQLLFFLSGVVIDLRFIPAPFGRWLSFNPMAVLMENFRLILIHNEWPQWGAVGAVGLVSLAMAAGGAYVIHRNDTVYPKIC